MEIGGKKMRNASGQRGDNERQKKKKANKDTSNNDFSEHIRHFLYKMCNWDASRCRRAKCTRKRAALASAARKSCETSTKHPRSARGNFIPILKTTRDEIPMEQGVYGGCLLCPLYPLLALSQ